MNCLICGSEMTTGGCPNRYDGVHSQFDQPSTNPMSETKLTRYDINCEDIPEHCKPLIVSDNGDYCLFSDADAEIERLRKENDLLQQHAASTSARASDLLERATTAEQKITALESELLRVRTTGHGAAHELDNIAVECGLGHSPKPGTVAAHVRELESACNVLGAEVYGMAWGEVGESWRDYIANSVMNHPLAPKYVKEPPTQGDSK